MHSANDGEEGVGIHQPESGARKQTGRRRRFGLAVPAPLVKFQVNEQETELELEVGPENDDGQAEKWKANVVVVGGYSRLCWADNERIQDFQGGQQRLKIK